MKADDKVIDKIRKLLALATSPNEHEAASAAAKAQDLMQEYDLSVESVSVKVDPRTGGITETDRIVLRAFGKPGGWKVRLFETIAKTSDCWITTSQWHWDGKQYSRDDTAVLIGRPLDIQLAHYLFDYLVTTLERLQKEYGDSRWADLREYAKQWGMSTHDAERDYKAMGKHPLRSKDSWIKGAVLSVVQTLEREKYERDHLGEDQWGLVVSKEGEKEAFVQWQRDVKEAERAGLTVDEVRSQREARRAAFRAQAPVPYVAPVETTRERKAREAREAKDQKAWEAQCRRDEKRRQAAAMRELLRTDLDAYQQGRATGATIATRRGVGTGQQ